MGNQSKNGRFGAAVSKIIRSSLKIKCEACGESMGYVRTTEKKLEAYCSKKCIRDVADRRTIDRTKITEAEPKPKAKPLAIQINDTGYELSEPFCEGAIDFWWSVPYPGNPYRENASVREEERYEAYEAGNENAAEDLLDPETVRKGLVHVVESKISDKNAHEKAEELLVRLDRYVLLENVRECDGYEIHEDNDDFPIAKRLEAEGRITIGAARGPDRKWRRLEIKP